MTNRAFGPTVRDFSKTTAARGFLKTKFKFDALPCPNLTPIKTVEGIPPNLLGATFDYVLLLLIERLNPNFQFQLRFSENFSDQRTKSGRALRDYLKSGIFSDLLIDKLISYGESRQKSFQDSSTRNKLIISDSLRDELRRMHQLAERIDWTIKDLFPPKGWLTDGRLMNGIPDLILDTKLFEVKAVKDASRHDE